MCPCTLGLYLPKHVDCQDTSSILGRNPEDQLLMVLPELLAMVAWSYEERLESNCHGVGYIADVKYRPEFCQA